MTSLEHGALGGRIRPRRGTPSSLRELVSIAEWMRYAWERLFIYPVAPWLPLGITLRLTQMVGFLEALLPTVTAKVAREEVAAATGGLRGRAAVRLVARRLSENQRHLAYKRFISRHGLNAAWKFVETGPASARSTLAERGPVLLVGGHFQGTASCLVWAGVLGEPVMPTTVESSTAPWRLSPKAQRTRLSHVARTQAQSKLFVASGGARTAATPFLWGGDDRAWTAAPKRTSVQDRIVAALSTPSGRAAIYPDAIWKKPNSYRRAFAGAANRDFALGAARIARLAQATIVPFVAVHDTEPMTVRIDWGEPIEPPPEHNAAADPATLDKILDFLERGIGRYPAEYNLPIGWDREWDRQRLCWRTNVRRRGA